MSLVSLWSFVQVESGHRTRVQDAYDQQNSPPFYVRIDNLNNLIRYRESEFDRWTQLQRVVLRNLRSEFNIRLRA